MFTKECPICGNVQSYSTKFDRDYAIKQNRRCYSCAHVGAKYNPPFVRNCPKCNKQLTYSRRDTLLNAEKHNRICQRCNTDVQRLKRKGNRPSPSDETRKKIRLSNIKQWHSKVGQLKPGYNPLACKIFEEINKEKGWNGIHAENGGEFHIKELGYWVDFYEPTLNLVIEYDEIWHKYTADKDARRQREIEQLLKCKFIRIRQNENWRDAI